MLMFLWNSKKLFQPEILLCDQKNYQQGAGDINK